MPEERYPNYPKGTEQEYFIFDSDNDDPVIRKTREEIMEVIEEDVTDNARQENYVYVVHKNREGVLYITKHFADWFYHGEIGEY